MRIAPLLALAALAACSHNTIPGTNVRDDPHYKEAMEARDANALISLAAPGYFDKGDPARPGDAHDLEGLRKSVPRDFKGVRALKLDIDIRNLKIEGDRAQVDFFGVMRYAVAVPNGEKWFTESDDQRMKFVKVYGDWKISSGM